MSKKTLVNVEPSNIPVFAYDTDKNHHLIIDENFILTNAMADKDVKWRIGDSNPFEVKAVHEDDLTTVTVKMRDIEVPREGLNDEEYKIAQDRAKRIVARHTYVFLLKFGRDVESLEVSRSAGFLVVKAVRNQGFKKFAEIL